MALTFFLIAYISQGPNLPEIPALLLALTSGAAAVYVGNKAADQNRPTLSGLVPASVRPGDELTISGQGEAESLLAGLVQCLAVDCPGGVGAGVQVT